MDIYNTQSFFLDQNPCSSSPCFNNGTCQAGYTYKGFRCKCPSGFTGAYCDKGNWIQNCKVDSILNVTIGYSWDDNFCSFFPFPFLVFNVACSFDFENGIGEWKMTGRAFINQPTFVNNPAARERESAQQQGDWWIGGGLRIDPARTIIQEDSTQMGPIHPRERSFLLVSVSLAEISRFSSVEDVKWYSCGAYCQQSGEIIHFDHHVSFDYFETTWVNFSKYQRFGLSKLRNHFELRDIHEIRLGLQ